VKNDWDSVKKRYAAFWAADLYDRPLLLVTAPKSGADPAPPWHDGRATEEEKWTDIGFAIWSTEQGVPRTWYGPDTLPALHSYKSYIGMSAGGAMLYGATAQYAEDTVWVAPVDAAERYPAYSVVASRRQHVVDCFRDAGLSSRGRYYIRESFANHAGDTLAALRGTENLLVDLMENPSWVRDTLYRISRDFTSLLHDVWPLVSPEVIGREGWLSTAGIWSEQINFCSDCDVSCMVSPRHFEEIFLPPLLEAIHGIPHNIYHLDGAGAIGHLGALLASPEIHAIQWVPGAGREAILPWVGLLRRIQASGRSIQVVVRPEEVEPLLDEISPRGLLMVTSCTTEGEGRALLERLDERFSARM
jgi:hypothetical protein